MDWKERYALWCEAYPETRAELDALPEQEKEDRFYMELEFGTAGMRGVIAPGTNRMNQYNVRSATQGLADVILQQAGGAERGVAIAYDSRRFSDYFAKQAALVLCARGIRTYLFESLRPVPILSFTVRHLKTQAGIVITASHNPPQYNGYKVYWEDGGQLPPEHASEVLDAIRVHPYGNAPLMEETEALEKGLLQYIGAEVDDAYMEKVRALCTQPELCREEGKTMRIVYTPLNGSGSVPVQRILREIGFQNVFVVPEQKDPDPDFTTVGTPNPENLSAFRLAQALAEKVDADLVFATDPDCDRLGCLVRDGQGQFRVLTGNQIGCLLLYGKLQGLKNRGALPVDGAVIKSIVTTNLADRIAAGFGVACYHVLTGFKFIAETIESFQKEDPHTFLFGFEESYGFLSGNFVRDKDGVIASMLLSETAAECKRQGKTLFDGLQEIYQKFGFFAEITQSVPMPGQNGLARMKELMGELRETRFESFAGKKVVAVCDYKNGTRTLASGACEQLAYPSSDVLFYELEDDMWLCVRPSGTEPKIKLYVCVHGESEQAAQTLAKELFAAGEKALGV